MAEEVGATAVMRSQMAGLSAGGEMATTQWRRLRQLPWRWQLRQLPRLFLSRLQRLPRWYIRFELPHCLGTPWTVVQQGCRRWPGYRGSLGFRGLRRLPGQ